MAPLRFAGQVRYFRPEKAAGLAVVDIPSEMVGQLGGLKQQRCQGTINAAPFTSSTMPAGGGRLALTVSKAMLAAARVGVGDTADFEIRSIGRE